MDSIESIVRAVMERLGRDGLSSAQAQCDIPVETSARHVHLSGEDLRALFGSEDMPKGKDISQPGQFASTLRVRLIGPRGCIDNVAVLGPARKTAQVEISQTDARTLGIEAPVRLSGCLSGAAFVSIQAGEIIIGRRAAIVAQRHLHMTPKDAQRLNLNDGCSVSVRVKGLRPLILEDVPVRVTDESRLALHIDTDEANAAGAYSGCVCNLAGTCASLPSSAPENRASQPPAKTAVSAPADGKVQGRLISEQEVLLLKKQGVTVLRKGKGQIITPLARDTAQAAGITVKEEA